MENSNSRMFGQIIVQSLEDQQNPQINATDSSHQKNPILTSFENLKGQKINLNKPSTSIIKFQIMASMSNTNESEIQRSNILMQIPQIKRRNLSKFSLQKNQNYLEEYQQENKGKKPQNKKLKMINKRMLSNNQLNFYSVNNQMTNQQPELISSQVKKDSAEVNEITNLYEVRGKKQSNEKVSNQINHSNLKIKSIIASQKNQPQPKLSEILIEQYSQRASINLLSEVDYEENAQNFTRLKKAQSINTASRTKIFGKIEHQQDLKMQQEAEQLYDTLMPKKKKKKKKKKQKVKVKKNKKNKGNPDQIEII
ncbi:UNKNOWN [Stylonychia lemnae]|uniref:Uncharacterized protein n=1 Tax=Stylonychia lemnae TaxID=5949 RepID=A0A077ZNY0_STYLE|nr:UNKNOWN [Stylonychia lemnae]|eukprot:CDW71090.1 UNKNOWN [Stylonychia lemnae]